MRVLIGANFPDTAYRRGIRAERPDADYVWVLDPIDGTKSFISALPPGHADRAHPFGARRCSGCHQPFVGERFSGDGASARYRGPAGERALLVRACASLAQAVLYTTSPRLMNTADRRRSSGRGDGAALALRRRLLRLLHAGGRPHRLITRPSSSRTTSSRWSRSSPARAASSPPGGRLRRRRRRIIAAATSACTPPRWRCCGVRWRIASRNWRRKLGVL